MAYDRQRISITWNDTRRRDKHQRVFLRTTDAAQAEIDAAAVAAALRAVSDLGIEKYSVLSEQFTEDTPGANSNVDEGVTLTANLDNNPDKGSFSFPGKEAAYLLPGGVVDVTHADIAALQALFDPTTGIAYIDIQALLHSGNSVAFPAGKGNQSPVSY